MLGLNIKVARYIDDDVSGTIFATYLNRFQEHREPTEYFFPKIIKGSFVWTEPLQNFQHNRLIRKLVSEMQYDSVEKQSLYNSTSIRTANQVLTEEHVQKFRAQRNTALGWAAKSETPWQHYTPREAAARPGPLFWDIDFTNEHLRQVIAIGLDHGSYNDFKILVLRKYIK